MTALRVLLTLIVVVAATAVVAIAASVVTPDGVLVRKEVIKKVCRYDRDCARHAYCKLQNECSCKDGFFIYKEDLRKSEVCLKRVMGEGDDCVESAQCQLTLGTSAECRLGWDGSVCRCIDGAHEVENRCYNTSKVGERCVAKNNCRIEGGPTLTCANGLCVCPRLQHGSSNGLRCLDDRRLGDDCSEDDECITTNSHCMGICECRVQYVANERNRRCLRVADSVGDMCEEDLQCNRFISDAECTSEGQCVCRDGYHPGPKGVRCWRSTMLGGACTDTWECLAERLPLILPYNKSRSVCQDRKCICADGLHADDLGQFCVGKAAMYASLSAWVLLLAAAAVASVAGARV